ncbi:2-oxoglutarate-dependent dioxygenase DAO-like [Cryptomeria japonica]|uniref:2-oxoglutarate-dependent dioxygenase DAO-like n=1 Tax=Cryptomeria japonica TaxID=3369 RepID=UPI0027DA086F|nr:2-oxoglutarate-dependent dioxygenase DAO-like [Cryptomeria japonica]
MSKLRKNTIPGRTEACKEWGFFQLVNHGIPVDLLQKAENGGRNLLSMPNEVKDKTSAGKPFDTYFRRGNYETFHLRDSTSPGSFEQMYAKLCPEKNPNLCEAMAAYASCVSDLAHKITKIILAGLGLDAQNFYHNYFENCAKVLRINGYSLENMSIGEEALVSHTDTGCLTILYSDDAWINGRYRSAEHRVICTGCRKRMSIVVLTTFPEETEIWAPEELVDDNHPRRYKPFVFSDLMREKLSNKGDNVISSALERFAGI